MQFEYSDTDSVSDIEYPDSDRTDLNPSKRIRSQIRSENIRTMSPDIQYPTPYLYPNTQIAYL
jgi:hypothetical protein